MTKQELQMAINFLQRMFVGQQEVDNLEKVLQALRSELARRNKK